MQNNNLSLDDFKIIRTLGEGYSGVVKLAQQTSSDTFVALKIINKNLKSYQKVLKDLEKEAQILSSIDHPYITKLLAFNTKGVLRQDSTVVD